jgi:acyl-CoA thioester hydrolase
MTISAATSITVQFYDVDPMNVVWHGNYPRYLEQARTTLLDKIGYSYAEMAASGVMWPIVEMQLKYIRPVRFGQTITVEATIVEYENRIKIAYRINDAVSGELLTKAQTTQLAIEAATGELQFVSPQALLDKIRALA